jgi:hypothetical protein
MAIDPWRPRGFGAPNAEPFRAFNEFVGRMLERMFDEWLSPRMVGEARGWSPAVDMILNRMKSCSAPTFLASNRKDIEAHRG